MSLRVSRNSRVLVSPWPATEEMLTVASTNQLYAFFYDPGRVEKRINAWGIYNPEKEFERMGLGTRTQEWRFTTINKDYSV
jgi:myotubularin-related protein 6/7/8